VGSPWGGTGTALGQFGYVPYPIRALPNNWVAAVDSTNERVEILNSAGVPQGPGSLGSAGTGPGQFSGQINDVAEDSGLQYFWVETASGVVDRFNASTGAYLGQFSVPSSSAQLAVDSVHQRVYVTAGGALNWYSYTGTLIGSLATPANEAVIATDPSGQVYLTNYAGGVIQLYQASGTGLTMTCSVMAGTPNGPEYSYMNAPVTGVLYGVNQGLITMLSLCPAQGTPGASPVPSATQTVLPTATLAATPLLTATPSPTATQSATFTPSPTPTGPCCISALSYVNQGGTLGTNGLAPFGVAAVLPNGLLVGENADSTSFGTWNTNALTVVNPNPPVGPPTYTMAQVGPLWGSAGSGPGQYGGAGGAGPDMVRALANNWVAIVDQGNSRIDIVDTTGAPQGVGSFGTAGTGPGQFSSMTDVAADANLAYFWVLDPVQGMVKQFNGSTGAFIRQFSVPSPIAFPNTYSVHAQLGVDTLRQRLYVVNQPGALSVSNVLYWYDFSGNLLGQMDVGTGQFGGSPFMMAVDPSGQLLLGSGPANPIELWEPTATGLVNTCTSAMEPGTTWGLSAPTTGTVYAIVDEGSFEAYTVCSTAGTPQYTVTQTPVWTATPTQSATASPSGTSSPTATASPTGVACCIAQTGEFGVGVGYTGSGYPSSPNGLAAGPDGTLYASTSFNNLINVFNAAGVLQRSIAGTAPDEYIAVLPGGNNLAVTNAGANQVQILSAADGSVLSGGFGTAGLAAGELSQPGPILVDGAGNYYVVDSPGGVPRVQQFTSAGTYQWGFSLPAGTQVAFDGLAVDNVEQRLYAVTASTIYWYSLASGALEGQMTLPSLLGSEGMSVAVESDGTVIVALDYELVRFTPTSTGLQQDCWVSAPGSPTQGMVSGPNGSLYYMVLYGNVASMQVCPIPVSGGPNGNGRLAGKASPTAGPRLSSLGKPLIVVPNPAAREATALYTLGVPAKVALVLYSLNGSVVETLDEGYQPAGTAAAQLPVSGLGSGIYLVSLLTDEGGGYRVKATFKLAVVH